MPWFDAGPATLAPGRMREAEIGRVALLLINLDGTLHAVSAVCPHHAAWLSQGQISGTAIDCPRHQGQFDIATGQKLRGPDCANLRIYPTRTRGARVEVALGSVPIALTTGRLIQAHQEGLKHVGPVLAERSAVGGD
jgi:nitrite reductase/ring-hydroxylating ferredoxin subunit